MIKNLKKHKIESTYLLLSGAKESNKKRLWKIKLVLIDSSEIIPPNNLHFSPIIHNKIEIQFIKRSIKCPKTKLNTPWDCKVDFWETSKKKEIRTVAFTTKIPEIHKVKQKSQNLLPPCHKSQILFLKMILKQSLPSLILTKKYEKYVMLWFTQYCHCFRCERELKNLHAMHRSAKFAENWIFAQILHKVCWMTLFFQI